jgi:hypothetical protein
MPTHLPTDIPTVTSQARARAYVDDELRAPPREGKRARPRSSKKSASPMSRLFCVPRLRLSSGAVIGAAALCALMTGVVVNALFLQTDKHRAPLFPASVADAAPAQGRLTVLPHEAQAPTPAPRPALEGAAAPAPLPVPLPRAARETTGSVGRQSDGVAALLNGSPARAEKPREAEQTIRKRVAAKPETTQARSQPTKAVAEHRRAAAVAAKPKPAQQASAPKPAAKPVAAAQDKRNSPAVTEKISDEMRRKLAALAGGEKVAAAKPKRAAKAAQEE